MPAHLRRTRRETDTGPGVDRDAVHAGIAGAQVAVADHRNVVVRAQADPVAVEGEGRLEVGHFEVDVPDPGPIA